MNRVPSLHRIQRRTIRTVGSSFMCTHEIFECAGIFTFCVRCGTGGNRSQGQEADGTAPRRSIDLNAATGLCDSLDNRIKSASNFAARNSSTMELLIESNEIIARTHNFLDGVYGKRNECYSSTSNDHQAAGEFLQKTQRYQRAVKKASKLTTDQERKERRRKKLIRRNISL